MKKSVAAMTTNRSLEPPPPPEGVSYPVDFKFKRCKRCGVWNCAPAQYNQAESPEFAWGAVIAWEGGSIFHPLGLHCLMCRKDMFEKVATANGRETLNLALGTLPQNVALMSACSGTGIFELVTTAVIDHINMRHMIDKNLSVCTKFLCEIVQNKQKFLKDHIIAVVGESEETSRDPDTVCLFEDITKLDKDSDRKCVIHNCNCALPGPSDIHADHELTVFAAGFSCKSFSKMNVQFNSLTNAMAEGKECSSTLTFAGVRVVLEQSKPHVVLLENVDSIDTHTGEEEDKENQKTNLKCALDAIKDLGYHCVAIKLRANNYGVPQRRCRYYIICLRDVFADSADSMLTKIQDLLPRMQVPDMPKPDEFLLNDDDQFVKEELARRKEKSVNRSNKEKSGGGSATWVAQHTGLAEQYGVVWPLVKPTELLESEWFRLLPEREQEVLCFVYIRNARLPPNERIAYVDISQTVLRLPTSTVSSQVVPTIMPSGKLWSIARKRPLIGREVLALQGLWLSDLPTAREVRHSDAQLCDFAGNMFSMPCIMAALIAVVSQARLETDSEEEQLNEIHTMFGSAMKKQRI